jgi:uncharacterized membrane protein
MSTNRRWITILAVLGIGISGYLSYTHLSGAPIFCGGSSACEQVNTSRYAFLGPIPIALLGLGLYATIALLSLIPAGTHRVWIAQAIFGLSLAGLLYSLYLTYVELFVLYAVCGWCAASAIVILLIFILALPRSAPAAHLGR